MDKWISWLKKDISVRNRHKSKKLSLKKQRKVVQLFNNLFASGFSLTDMVTFLKRSKLLSDYYTDRMNKALLEGKDLSKMLGELGFSDTVITQVALADLHGNISRSLLKIESYLANLLLVRKKVIEVATYPLILLTFLVLIMIGLRHYLMPQLGENNFATSLITNVPNIFLLLLAAVLIFSLIFYIVQKRLSRIKVACFLTTIPLVGSYVKLYLTAYYAREWGNLLSQGVELDQIVKVMQNQKSKLFREIGYDMEEGFLSGKAFHQKVLDYPFFLTELSLMIEYDQVKAKLGTELDIYADEKWEDFFTKLARATQLIQPVIFIFVALIIVMIYAAMLLPMYQNMEILS
ncbi:TPA: competence type IV pilus assembly protein ComGB [Streptococcus agalactiae]